MDPSVSRPSARRRTFVHGSGPLSHHHLPAWGHKSRAGGGGGARSEQSPPTASGWLLWTLPRSARSHQRQDYTLPLPCTGYARSRTHEHLHALGGAGCAGEGGAGAASASAPRGRASGLLGTTNKVSRGLGKGRRGVCALRNGGCGARRARSCRAQRAREKEGKRGLGNENLVRGCGAGGVGRGPSRAV